MIKEEPADETLQFSLGHVPDDEIIASYEIVPVNNLKYKIMSISGLSNVLDRTKHYDVSKRTDSKEIKIESKQNDINSICYTKETNLNLDKKSYAVKLSRETGQAYFVPISSMHSISFLDESNKSIKVNDSQNMIYEDCFKMPNPSRNKHDQLCIEMKNHLYKPLSCVIQPDHVKQFLMDLFISTTKRQSHLLEVNAKTELKHANAKESLDMMNCPHWHMNKINLYDIKQMDVAELQIEALLRKGQVLTFSEIQEILTVDSSKLLNILPTIALLILGNWVIKSNLLYKVNPFQDSETKQSHYKDLIAARDFLLWHVACKKRFTFADIYIKFKKSSDHEEILNRLTIRRGLNEPICFILPEDEDFLRMYSSNIVSLHKNTIRILDKHKTYLET